MPRPPRIAQPDRRDGVAGALRDWKAVLLFAAAAAVFFRKILMGEAWLWEDMMYFSYPVRVFAATSMAMGHLPLWNPYTFGGMPFLADIQTTVLYLPCAALALFVRDGGLGFYPLELMVIAHYVLAGWAMYLLASSLRVERGPALFAGVAYMLSGFMIAHAIHQQIITMAAWFPLITMLFRMALRSDRWHYTFLCALVLGHSTLAGYPQLSLYFHVFLLAYFLFTLLETHRGRALLSAPARAMTARAAMIVILGLALAAFQLLPTQELAGLSQRAQITYEKSTEGSLAWSQLLTLIVPKLFGAAGPAGSTYWGPGTYWYFWETCVYLGILPLMLLLASTLLLRRMPLALFFGGVALFTILFALGPNFFLHRLFQEYVPGFAKFRNPARVCVFLAMAASLLSGLALQALKESTFTPAGMRHLRWLLYGLTAAGVALWAALTGGLLDVPLGVPAAGAIGQALRTDAHRALLLVLLSGGLLIAMAERRAWFPRLAAGAVLLFFADMYTFGAEQNCSTTNPADYFERAEPMARFFRGEMQHGLFRINTRNQYGMIMDRNQGMVDRIFTLEGYTPLVLERANAPFNDTQRFDLLNVRYTTAFDAKTRTLRLAENPTYLPRAFILHETRTAPTEEALVAAIRDSAWHHRTTALLESAPPLSALRAGSVPAGSARITAYSDNRIDLDAATDATGILVLSEVYYPGWKAYVDGAETPVLRTDYLLRGIVLPPGNHHVLFVFSPPPFVTGAWLSGGALVLCLAGMALPALRRTPAAEKGG